VSVEPHRAGSALGLIGIGALSLLLIYTGATLDNADRELFSLTYDARWLYVAAGVLGLASLLVRRLVIVWAVAMTIPTLGRAVTLLLDGSSIPQPRSYELRGALTWFVLWVMGGLSVIVVEGSAALRRYVRG
jgi:hypothetical protein